MDTLLHSLFRLCGIAVFILAGGQWYLGVREKDFLPKKRFIEI